MFILLAVFAVFISSLFLLIKLSSKHKKYAKYEFENRTDGGAVNFENYDDSVKHNVKKNTLEALAGPIVFVCFCSGIALVVMVLTFSNWA